MTFQPPPPPPPPPPPGGQPNQPYGAPANQPYGAPPPAGPPPATQWGTPPPAPSGGYPAPGAGFDPKSINPLDWVIIGAGLLTFIFSFVSYYTAKVSFEGISESAHENAWHGFFGWFAMLCAVAGTVIVLMGMFAPQIKLRVANRLAALGLYAVATVCVIIALFVTPGVGDVPSQLKVDFGRGFGYWISLIVIILGLVACLIRFQQGGGKLPGALSKIPNLSDRVPPNLGGGPQPPSGYTPPTAPGGYAPPAAPGGYQPPAAPGGYQPPAAPGGYAPPAAPPPATPPGYGTQPPPPPGYSPPPQ